jgi:hypothetical protein
MGEMAVFQSKQQERVDENEEGSRGGDAKKPA